MFTKLLYIIYRFLLFRSIRIYLSTISEINRFRVGNIKPNIIYENDYSGQKILIIALYEKGEIRPDILRFINIAKSTDLYILAINTQRVLSPKDYSDKIDCYIEKPNFGRDFGSYKTGFLHIYSRGWSQDCPRVLMANDSVFYSSAHLPKFVSDMMDDKKEVMGSTENYEIEHHLGSFCIAISGKILVNAEFERFWQKYRLSDVRPSVIYHGEMALSKTLRKCASKPTELSALYGTARYSSAIRSNDELLTFSIRNARTSNRVPWKRFSLSNILDRYKKIFLFKKFDYSGNISIEGDNYQSALDNFHINSIDELSKFFQEIVSNKSEINKGNIKNILASELTEVFMTASQIHQNQAILLHMGLPIIKLDGLYRGMFNISDIDNIVTLLNPDESEELLKLLMARPCGMDIFNGIKLRAFMHGLI